MADFADIASDYTEKLLEQQLAAHRAKAAVVITAAIDCEYCGVDIPLARREAVPGCTTCIDCQSLLEVRRG